MKYEHYYSFLMYLYKEKMLFHIIDYPISNTHYGISFCQGKTQQ